MITLDKEIDYIKDPNIKESAKILAKLLPDYFWHVEASSTGKYHPTFSLGEGGLVRHSKAVVRIAYELLNLEMMKEKYTEEERDLLIFACMFHDGLKLGNPEEKYTRFDHPILMANFIKDNKSKLKLNDHQIDIITSSIETHMGEWVNDYNGNKILSKPRTKYQRFVHMCDYLASRKFLDIKFINNEIEGSVCL